MSVGEQVWAGQGSSEQSVHPSCYGWNGRHLSLLLQSNAYPSNAAAEAIFQELWWITKKFLFQNKSSNSLSLSLYQDIRINASLRGTELTLFLNISKMHTKVQRIMRKYVDPNRYINNWLNNLLIKQISNHCITCILLVLMWFFFFLWSSMASLKIILYFSITC